MIDAALKQNPINIYGRRDVYRNYIYDENLFLVIDETIMRAAIGTIEVIAPKNVLASEVAKVITTVANSSSEIRFNIDKPDMADNAFFVNDDVFESWKLKYINFEDALKKVVLGLSKGR